MERIIVVISCYKEDFFLTRICAASIKYFHPEAEIYLLKDYSAGDFNTRELEQAFQVKVLDLGLRDYGWGAAKIHFILSKQFEGQRVFVIDSDTVFAGRFLENLYQKTKGIDFVVNPDFCQSPYEGMVPHHYYKFDEVKKFDSSFIFPGYVFNTGHLLATPGKVKPDDIDSIFDGKNFPFYTRLDILPKHDQSILNYILPKMDQDGLLKLTAEPLMVWSNGSEAQAIDLNELKRGDAYQYLIHWAGVLRVPYLDAMTRPDILHFFQDYYYSKVPFGGVIKRARALVGTSDYYLRNLYRKTIKPLIKNK